MTASTAEHPALAGWRLSGWLALACLLVYGKTLAFQLTGLDDGDLVMRNRELISDPGNVFRLFRTTLFDGGATFLYRPLLNLSFMFDTLWGGGAHAAYRLTNLVLHILASCLLVPLLTRMGSARTSAFFWALLFAMHPVLTPAVAWLPGRNDSLLAVFVFTSLLGLHRFLETRSRAGYVAHLLAFALALFTKETAVVLAVIYPLYIRLVAREPFTRPRSALLIPGWAAGLLTWFVLRGTAAGTEHVGAMFGSLCTGLPALLGFLGKLAVPVNLSVLPAAEHASLLAGVCALLLAAALTLIARGRRPGLLAFGPLWFLLFLAPTLLMPENIHFEHRAYVPAAGLLFFLAGAGELLPRSIPRALRPLLAAGIALAFAVLSFARADDYLDRLRFWESAAAGAPESSLAHSNLGAVYLNRLGAVDLAEAEFNKALDLKPDNLKNHLNLAVILLHRKRFEEAEQLLRELIAVQGPRDLLLYLYAGLCFEQVRYERAAELWQRTLRENPGFLHAYRNLAVFHRLLGNDVESEQFARRLRDRTTDAALLASLDQPGQSWYYEIPAWW